MKIFFFIIILTISSQVFAGKINKLDCVNTLIRAQTRAGNGSVNPVESIEKSKKIDLEDNIHNFSRLPENEVGDTVQKSVDGDQFIKSSELSKKNYAPYNVKGLRPKN